MSAKPTLLAFAKADLKTAKKQVNSADKYEKHIAAYHTQQAIEKTLKYLAEKKGQNLWGHDLTKLILQCRKLGIQVPALIVRNSAMSDIPFSSAIRLAAFIALGDGNILD